MNDFLAVIKSVFLKNYVNFQGRATRKEFWYAFLFNFVVAFFLGLIPGKVGWIIQIIYSLAVLLPMLSVGARRLHDINKSGWFLLLALIPMVGIIILIVWWAQTGDPQDNIVDKLKNMMERGKAIGKQFFEKVKASVKDKANDNQKEKLFTPWLISLLGVYSIIFFDIYIGLLLLVPAIFYLVLKKVKPKKAEQLVDNVKEKIQPITSKSMLKHGLIALLAGVVVLRTLGIIPGWIIIGLSVVFLALTKFASTIAQKIDDGCMGISDKLKLGTIWQNNWVKVAVFALLLLVPILGVRPGQSVYGIAQSDKNHNMSSSSNTNSRSETHGSKQSSNNTTTFRSERDVKKYLRNHTFVSNAGNKLEFSSTGFSVNYQQSPVNVLEVIEYDSKTAIVQARGPVGTYTFYVYGAQGYVIEGSDMYFAK